MNARAKKQINAWWAQPAVQALVARGLRPVAVVTLERDEEQGDGLVLTLDLVLFCHRAADDGSEWDLPLEATTIRVAAVADDGETELPDAERVRAEAMKILAAPRGQEERT